MARVGDSQQTENPSTTHSRLSPTSETILPLGNVVTRAVVTTETIDWDLQWTENAERFNRFPNEELVRWASTLERGSRVLEVGCGAGANLRALESLGMDPWGVDVAEEAVRLSQDAWRPSQVKLTSACELPFDSLRFDAVCDVQCLQHLPADELPRAYSEIHRVLKPSGVFFQVALTAGQEHFPALSFNDDVPVLKHLNRAGLRIREAGWLKRCWHRRFYEYVLVECERV